MRGKIWLGAAAAVALLAAPAFAADNDVHVGDYNVALNGGVGGFLGGLSNYTGVGPTWGLTADGAMGRSFGWEFGYDGSRTPITDNRLGGDPAIWRHGVDAMAKAYVPGLRTWRPYAGLGIGESYVNANDDAEPLYNNDFITEVPVAAGVDLNTNGGIHAGIRAAYHLMAGEEFANKAAGRSVEGGLLTGQLTLGGHF